MSTPLLSTEPSPRSGIDVHIHLAGRGCGHSGCFLHPRLERRYTIRMMQWLHGISHEEMRDSLDLSWPQRLSTMVAESPLQAGVVLGFDGVMDSHGQPDPHLSQLIIPDEWVFQVCQTFPHLLPAPSINPYHHKALERLEAAIAQKAVALKWLPSVHNICPSDTKLRPFYEKLARHHLPLIIHCGGEQTFQSLTPEFNHVTHLEWPLRLGVTVICAHSGSEVLGRPSRGSLHTLKQLLVRYPHLWLDNAGLCTPTRFHHLPALAQDPLVASRTLYGSDFPVPSHSFYYVRQLGLKRVWELERTTHWLTKDIRTKLLLGYPPDSLTRAYDVLPHADYWLSYHRALASLPKTIDAPGSSDPNCGS